MTHRTTDELLAALDHLRASPSPEGQLQLIVRRPAVDEREVLETANLRTAEGVEGDTWKSRSSKRTADGSAHPDMQLNIMNIRAARLLAGSDDRIPLAGDQLYVDLDLSDAGLPPWTELTIGDAVIQITDQPHNGCAKFADRFGRDALRFVNSPVGKELHLRGVNARVVEEGEIRTGDVIRPRPA